MTDGPLHPCCDRNALPFSGRHVAQQSGAVRLRRQTSLCPFCILSKSFTKRKPGPGTCDSDALPALRTLRCGGQGTRIGHSEGERARRGWLRRWGHALEPAPGPPPSVPCAQGPARWLPARPSPRRAHPPGAAFGLKRLQPPAVRPQCSTLKTLFSL